MSAYPKGSKLLFTITCNFMTIIENEIIDKIKKLYKHRTDCGREYFQGNLIKKNFFYLKIEIYFRFYIM